MCSGAPELKTRFWWGSCCFIFSFMCTVLLFVFSPFVLFILAIVLYVRFLLSDYDYPFGISS